LRIILADHHNQSRWALKTLLEEQADFELVGEAADVQELLLLVETNRADLILIDGDLPGRDAEELIARLHNFEPSPIVVAMSSRVENGRKLLKAGADSFVSKGDSPDWLLDTLRKFESLSK
jgi:DNA-binding NarL/FixJ family response regulator